MEILLKFFLCSFELPQFSIGDCWKQANIRVYGMILYLLYKMLSCHLLSQIKYHLCIHSPTTLQHKIVFYFDKMMIMMWKVASHSHSHSSFVISIVVVFFSLSRSTGWISMAMTFYYTHFVSNGLNVYFLTVSITAFSIFKISTRNTHTGIHNFSYKLQITTNFSQLFQSIEFNGKCHSKHHPETTSNKEGVFLFGLQ